MPTRTQELEVQLAGFRRELLAHCYRMTGALSDAEDALQNTFVRAWQGVAKFEGRSSLRTWLYRIATNACFDILADRRGRTMPYLVSVAAAEDEPPPEGEPTWLEPFPDTLLEDDPETRPDALYGRREATRLAFVAALQRLPARQRAILILRDVVALSAEETAATLEMTVAAANSLLQRARDTLASQPARRLAPTDAATLADVLARYIRAWEHADASELIALLRDDAISSMPPVALWLSGRDAIMDFMIRNVWPSGPLRLLPYAANAAPAVVVYRPDGLASLTVLELDGGLISAFHSFMTVDPARYAIAPALAAGS